MRETERYRLKKPDEDDFYDVEDFNSNMEQLEQIIGKNEDEMLEKIESEPAVDFSEAESPEFQQTIDSILNLAAEINQKLEVIENGTY